MAFPGIIIKVNKNTFTNTNLATIKAPLDGLSIFAPYLEKIPYLKSGFIQTNLQ